MDTPGQLLSIAVGNLCGEYQEPRNYPKESPIPTKYHNMYCNHPKVAVTSLWSCGCCACTYKLCETRFTHKVKTRSYYVIALFTALHPTAQKLRCYFIAVLHEVIFILTWHAVKLRWLAAESNGYISTATQLQCNMNGPLEHSTEYALTSQPTWILQTVIIISQSNSSIRLGYTNDDVQIIEVILKVTKISSTTTLDYWHNYYDSFGVTHAQYELWGYCVPLRWSWLNSKQQRHWIIEAFIMIVLQSHVFRAKFTTVVFWENDYDNENFHCCFLILFYNKFPKVWGPTLKSY